MGLSPKAEELRLVDAALAQAYEPQHYRSPVSRRIAVVGSGPAGLACADALSRFGQRVDVYEREPQLGGLLSQVYGPDKLPPEALARRLVWLHEAGVRTFTQTEVGSDVPWRTLMNEYDAVFAATGAGEPIPFSADFSHPQLTTGIDFLRGLYGRNHPDFELEAERVVILGAGDTALDCASAARLGGAAEVTMIARRNVRAERQALALACREGLSVVEGDEVLRIEPQGETLCLTLASGRRLSADLVIAAFGQRPHPTGDWAATGLVLRPDARAFCASPALKIYAGGDMLGASLVVNAVAQGRAGALAIGRRLGIFHRWPV